MTATVTPLRPARAHQDPALDAALGELLQLGLVVARVVARLAAVEDAALDGMAEGAAAAARDVAGQAGSLDEAWRAGWVADVSEAARAAAVGRVAVIAECFDKAARAVRRTVALRARLAGGRPFQDFSDNGVSLARERAGSGYGAGAGSAGRGRDGEGAEAPDQPESGDELGAGGPVLRGVCDDLAAAVASVTRLGRADGGGVPGSRGMPDRSLDTRPDTPPDPRPGPPPDLRPGPPADPPSAPDT